MAAEFGHFALILAFALAIVCSVIPMIGAQKRWQGWTDVAPPAAVFQFLLTLGAFVSLTYSFVVSDFSVRLVAVNSHSLKPMLYKVTGVWGNHEGSMLLWILILTLFGATVAVFGRSLPVGLRARVLSVQSMIGAAFFAFILFTSNPFERLPQPPMEGNGLNPILQDPGLAFHPPFLYLGYVGLSMAFSFAVAALIEGRVDAAWARWVRPWTLAAWMFLTVGIGLGSWWAYYELGWGGFWFWDPVENASFMPWLIGAALLHSAIVVEKRDTLKSWTILLAILAFSFSLIGTFIVRSGVITSVHAFANDPERGVFILAILAVTIGGALTLFAARAGAMRSTAAFSWISRESGLVLNNILLAVSAAVVFVGTIWPLVAEWLSGEKVSVGEPFFNLAFTPFMIVLAMLLPIGASLPWKRAKFSRTMRPLWGAVILSVVLGSAVWVMQTGGKMLAPVGVALASWIIFGTIADLIERVRLRDLGVSVAIRRAANLPRSDWGKMLAHSGFGIVIFAISTLMAWDQEDIRTVDVSGSFEFGGYTLTLQAVDEIDGPNYRSTIGTVSVARSENVIAVMRPEKRVYVSQGMPTTEAALHQKLSRDLYVVLGDRQEDGSWAMRTYIKPFANWIWLGAIIMGIGGLVSLTDRRYRLGVARSKAVAVPAE